MSDSIATSVVQGRELLESANQIVRTNVHIFQIVLNIQNIITRIPGQVERQQPVYLIDGLGKASPFHLEFVRSAEALVAVLAVNFQKYGAESKIRDGEFVIEDSATKQDIDLRKDWDLCSAPGQRVEMSMIFQQSQISITACPKCKAKCKSNPGGDVQWYRIHY